MFPKAAERIDPPKDVDTLQCFVGVCSTMLGKVTNRRVAQGSDERRRNHAKSMPLSKRLESKPLSFLMSVF